MTHNEYHNRKRLPGKPRVPAYYRLSKDDIFEVMNLRGEVEYVKITALWSQSLFDLAACYPNGTVIQGGQQVGMVQMHQIKERMEENDWRWLGPTTDHGKN